MTVIGNDIQPLAAGICEAAQFKCVSARWNIFRHADWALIFIDFTRHPASRRFVGPYRVAVVSRPLCFPPLHHMYEDLVIIILWWVDCFPVQCYEKFPAGQQRAWLD